ncbi:hypothetical protein [Halobacillus salinus]|uniref:Uncharacterized protein n=1 Tax=Halobacillus salinus TaxID=192814 RepID=A0A4Z0H0Q6_9BACI|nr:hypothetical protein [Halobacillus salinus]TGB02627.1 hypothetical protein E4663_10710 [Halobacillus salinus]
MDKKTIGIIVAYTVIMGSLLFATFGLNWNPSGYDYTIDGETLTIERGLFSPEVEESNISDNQSEALLFYLELSKERSQWKVDLTVIGLLLPFLLLMFVPAKRPFKEKVPKNWYRLIVSGAAVLYIAYSVTQHVEIIEQINEYAKPLL